MLYPKLKFPKVSKRPFFYTNFVQTIDGKVAVKEEGLPAGRQGYWPIGSRKDYEVLTELRTYADCLIHGGNLAREFGSKTLENINKTLFKQMRRVQGKSANLPYYVLTKHPKSLGLHLPGAVSIFTNDLSSLVDELKDRGYKHILVEGGPTLLGSFLNEDLIDEIFLTIAPKIYGSKPDSTKTLVEGILLPPNKIKLKLISVKRIKDELFLRYSVKN